MSLRKSTCLTPQRLTAARGNAQHSTGPRSEAGKERMKMNALQHGCDAAPENEAAVMRALGEDPERYAALQRELATSYGPGDALWDRQIADLGKLYWRRNRIERMETGLMRRALLAVEERRRGPPRPDRRRHLRCLEFSRHRPQTARAHPAVRAPAPAISRWAAIREQLPARGCHPHAVSRNPEAFWGQSRAGGRRGSPPDVDVQQSGLLAGRRTTRKAAERCEGTIGRRGGCGGSLAGTAAPAGGRDRGGGGGVRGGDEVQEEKDEIERDSCLAPAGETWEMLLRQEAALDRSIDRKVRIILTMRQEHARLGRGGSRTAPAREPDDRAAEELSKVVGLDAQTESPDRGKRRRNLKIAGTKRECYRKQRTGAPG